ncbi:MAG: hypothetical protein KAI83_12565 [Thiomargarita sp.]|nr:hypothetical protein [Thiomargarita sp.]
MPTLHDFPTTFSENQFHTSINSLSWAFPILAWAIDSRKCSAFAGLDNKFRG